MFSEGELGDSLYIVLAGKVKIARRATKRENILTIMGPSDMFGELSLFDPGPRTATATVVTDTHLAVLAHDALRPWISIRPETAGAGPPTPRANDAMAALIFTDVPAGSPPRCSPWQNASAPRHPTDGESSTGSRHRSVPRVSWSRKERVEWHHAT